MRKLKRQTAALWILVMVLLMAAGFYALGTKLGRDMHELRVVREGNLLRFTSPSDGPFVVFGVATALNPTESEKKVAMFARPIGIVDSHGAEVDGKDLKWEDALGESTTSPPEGAPLMPLYVWSQGAP